MLINVKEMMYSNEASHSLHRSFTMEDCRGTSFTQGTCYPLLGGRVCLLGGGKGCTCPPQPDGRGGREVVAAVLRAPIPWQGGKGTGRTTLSWEENSYNHITIRNNEMYHHCSLNLFSKYLIFCQRNY